MNAMIFGMAASPLPAGLDHDAIETFWSEPAAQPLSSLKPLLDPIITASPWLRQLLLEYPDFAARFREESPEALGAELLNRCGSADPAETSEQFKSRLRTARSRLALLVAIADIVEAWPVERTVEVMTDFADAAIRSALDFAMRRLASAGRLNIANPGRPQDASGYVVLAMGKHGARELNYSSDIDLIVLYDSHSPCVPQGADPSTVFVRLTRELVSLLQDVTEDGYVFRTDLRLRPDPRATQIAIDIEAASIYYENLGQNWERAAMIKARPVAGDMPLGEEFRDRLKPYIWRRYLDYAAIADIQSLKRQIHDVKGHGEIAVKGHNLKLGAGGIREIEFFVQTQQLIAGGKNSALRVMRTVDALAALSAAGWIAPDAAASLTRSYWFLRRLEHRVQMLRDQQDHCVPSGEHQFESFARFAGFSNGDALAHALRQTLETVSGHYRALFQESESLSSASGSLVFTGGEDDPATIATLQKLGYHQASEVSATIRGWHFGRYNATRSKTSRELLTELMPRILESFAATGDADGAFFAFDGFIRGLPAGVQLFSMLKANPELLDLLARVMGMAPRLTGLLSTQPRILEAVLDRAFFAGLPTPEDLQAALAAQLVGTAGLEDVMDRCRIFSREQNFRVSVHLLSGTLSPRQAGEGYSRVADTVLVQIHHAVAADMQRHHGRVPAGASAIVALGKLGGREMTAASDLDIMLVYDFDASAAMSDGERPLSPQQYYAKFAQRLVLALTVPTSEGVLYEVDMRLRPSGNKGPVAVSLASFVHYHAEEAWTWEKLALTRARVIGATADLAPKLGLAISQAIPSLRDQATTLADIRAMRGLMLREKKPAPPWDLKLMRGGLVDVEFIVQALQILGRGKARSTNTPAAIEALAAESSLDSIDAERLSKAWSLYSGLIQIIRLCVETDFRPVAASSRLNQTVSAAAAMPDIATTEALLAETTTQIIEIFDKIIGLPEF